jgi:hypothetical protein
MSTPRRVLLTFSAVFLIASAGRSQPLPTNSAAALLSRYLHHLLALEV